MEVAYYHIGEDMLPLTENQAADTAIVLVNYFGLVPTAALEAFVRANRNVIIDNTQGFYQPNITGAYSVYSPRKFFGVPDGCYVIGSDANRYMEEYGQDSSAPSASFLLARIESGGNANYGQYQESEKRLDSSDILRMSKLTQRCWTMWIMMLFAKSDSGITTTQPGCSAMPISSRRPCWRGSRTRSLWSIRC